MNPPSPTFSEEDIEDYTSGFCHALALALEEEFRTRGAVPVSFGAFLDEMDSFTLPSGVTGGPYHIFVIDSVGQSIDIRGRKPLEDLMEDWGYAPFVHIDRMDIYDWMADSRLLDIRDSDWTRAREVAMKVFDSIQHEYSKPAKGPTP